MCILRDLHHCWRGSCKVWVPGLRRDHRQVRQVQDLGEEIRLLLWLHWTVRYIYG